MSNKIEVSSEIGTLKRLLIHSPDGGIGKVVPSKAQDWLYEDIVDLKSMQAEYDVYKKLLLAYLDPEKLKEWFGKEIEDEANPYMGLDFRDAIRPSYVNPEKPDFIHSDKVVEIQKLLEEILKIEEVRHELVTTICGFERIDFVTQQRLLNKDKNWNKIYKELTPAKLAKVLITGIVKYLPKKKGEDVFNKQLFPPVPNFIFTRDIGIVVNNHFLLSKLNKTVRQRESILTKYIAYHFLFKKDWDKVIELTEDDRFFLYDEEDMKKNIVNVEGGDVMMVHKDHLLIGCSERTTPNAVNKVVKTLFEKKVVKKVTAVIIPNQRETMHIDTVFTQIKRNTWVLYGPLSSKKKDEHKDSYVPDLLSDEEKKSYLESDIKIVQFINQKDKEGKYKQKNFEHLEDLFTHISKVDFKCKDKMVFIYSGNLEYPSGAREQWTDSCNLVAVKEGIVIGYDRNRVTSQVFKDKGFRVIKAVRLIRDLKKAYAEKPSVDLTKTLNKLVKKDTLILLPSTELSRARGGSHCMSMPLLRDAVK